MPTSIVVAILVALLSLTLSSACVSPSPAPSISTPALPTPLPSPTPAVSTKMETDVGSPPAAGWKWAVVEFNGETEQSTVPVDHLLDWVFFVVKGSTEISMGDKKNVLSSGEGLVIPAGQQHSHRFLPQSKVIAFLLQRPPGNLHQGTPVLASESPLELRPAANYKLRIREITLSPGSRISDNLTADPNFGYVAEGVLSMSAGNTKSSVDAGKPFTLQTTTAQTVSNEGTAPLRVILVTVGP